MRHETWRDIETRFRAKTRHTSVETEPRLRHEKPCLEIVSGQDTCLHHCIYKSRLRAYCCRVVCKMLMNELDKHCHTLANRVKNRSHYTRESSGVLIACCCGVLRSAAYPFVRICTAPHRIRGERALKLDRKKYTRCYRSGPSLFTDHFSGPGRSIGRVCVSMCRNPGTVTFELNGFWRSHLARWFILTLCRSSLKVKVMS